MRSIFTSFIILGAMVLNLFGQAPADKIIGVWTNEKNTAQNRIYKKGNYYEAKIISAKEKEYVGKVTFYNLKFNGKEWIGKARHPGTGTTADVSMRLNGDNILIITASMEMISKTKNWYRIK